MRTISPSNFHKKIVLLLGLVFILHLNTGMAQVQPTLGGSSRLMNTALSEMEKGEYDKANGLFRQIIDSNLPIPSEMPYYFAETLFELQQFDNSANFLNKYLEINGFKGDNYDAAKRLEQKLENPLNEIKVCQLCDRRGYRYQQCFTCEGTKQIEQECNYCKAKGVIGCSRCVGSGMVTKRNVFNIVEYFECDRCSGKGRLECPTCNGSKKEVSACRTCQGSGRLQSDHLCDHEPEKEIQHLSQLFHKLKSHGNP
ncbi:molecular chaperone DnaJ [Rhodonellum sp.]|uniref:molecular chaperone DnaJ n=1 Tax=Rhodonellum sp. TaxID=2231180 RepID=UPI002716BC49|nr:molecular chaperone DnaJ [Rhodonellum sp.]MDO9552205.1 molecular chaperone DnaJ [Rhodonellum sp.]